MAFSNTKNKEAYVATEGQTTFQVTFQVYTFGELDVYVNSQLVTSGYSVMLPTDPSRVDNNEYGQVVFDVGLAVDTKVLLYRSPDMTQVEKMAMNGPFPSSIVERALDRCAQVNVAQAEKLGRCVALPIGSETTDIIIPEPVSDTVLIWNKTADALENGPTVEEVSNAQGYAMQAGEAQVASEQARDVAVSAAAKTPGPVAGDGDKMLVVKADGTVYELKDAATVLALLGAAPGKNLVDNPDFVVNQYGLDATGATAASGVYVIDRWKARHTVATNPTYSLTAEGNLRVESNAAETGVLGPQQIIRDYENYAGKEMTVTIKAKTNGALARLYAFGPTVPLEVTIPSSEAFETVSAAFTLPSSPAQFWIQPYLTNPIAPGEYIEVDWVKLELGPVSTPFEPSDKVEELDKCLSGAWILNLPINNKFAIGMANSGVVDCPFQFPNQLFGPLSSSISVSVNDINNFRMFASNGSSYVPTSISIISQVNGSMILRFGHGSIANGLVLTVYNAVAEKLIFDNNL